MAIKLSNVIGAPFADYVLRQLVTRTYNSSTGTTALGNRTNDQVLYLANKTSWVRLISSVDLAFPTGSKDTVATFIEKLGATGAGDYQDPNSLAKNWILEAGTSRQSNTNGIVLREGLGLDGAYGLGGTEELGYRPMPGLTSVTIETAGRLGSLRNATINFKVWNMNQLNTIEALYFRLGYSMLLEWGHTQYYKNPGFQNNQVNINSFGTFVRNSTAGIGNPFDTNLRKEKIQQEIEKQKFATSGNYDGMLGIVVNFNWSYNQEGGYDCSVKLVGLGAVMDSMRINQSYKLPSGLVTRYKNAIDAAKEYEAKQLAAVEAAARRAEAAAEQAEKARAGQTAARTGTQEEVNKIRSTPLPANPQDLYNLAVARGAYKGSFDDFINNKQYQARGIDSYTPRIVVSNNNYYELTAEANRNAGGVAETLSAFNERFDGIWFFSSGFKNNRVGGPGSQTTLGGALFNSFFRIPKTGVANIQFDIIQPEPPSIDAAVRYQDSKFSNLAQDKQKYGKYPTFYEVVKELDYKSANTVTTNGITTGEVGLDSLIVQSTPLPDGGAYLTENQFSFTITTGQIDQGGSTLEPSFIRFSLKVTTPEPNYDVTRRAILSSFEDWIKEGANATTSGITGPDRNGIVTIKGNFKTIAKGIPNKVLQGTTDNREISWTFETNNVAFILKSSIAGVPNPPTQPATGSSASVNSSTTVTKADTEQVEAYDGFASAIQAMLTVVQATSQYDATKGKLEKDRVVVGDLIPITREFYNDGCLAKVLDLSGKSIPPPAEFDLTLYAAKGFSSELMADSSKFTKIPYIGGKQFVFGGQDIGSVFGPNFSTLCKSLTIKYIQTNPDGIEHLGEYLVYIPLGYLLAFINNMCLFYDTKQKNTSTNAPQSGTDKRPYVYIDFNPETNFCLTSPQQFSIDPKVCIIPAFLNKDQYDALFPANAKPASPFDPKSKNIVSDVLNKNGLAFQNNSAYQGKTMNIMLCTQHLINILREFSTGDPEHAVALQPFLERIMRDVNKALGNINLFRIAYRDDTNTIQIQDDQFVPPLDGETTMLNRDAFYSLLKTNVLESGELPIFASQIQNAQGEKIDIPSLGIARQMQLRTALSTKMASMIAISAQAATGSVNSKDHTSLSWINQNYQDRYKPFIVDQDAGLSGNNSNPSPKNNNTKSSKNIAPAKQDNRSNDQKLADLFNDHVKAVYSNLALNVNATETSKNYYIERMSKVKSTDPVTIAAPFIPAELELTLDGISGIIMGNAFNIPQSRLPRSLRGDGGFAKVGFIVNGLTHNIQNNEWTTTIKGQMIKLREQSKLGTAQVPTGAQTGTLNNVPNAGTTNGNKNDINSPCYVPPFVLNPSLVFTLSGKSGDAIKTYWQPAFNRIGGQTRGMRLLLEAQTQQEGFWPAGNGYGPSPSFRTNNPGNIATSSDTKTYAGYRTLEEGVLAQIKRVNTVIAGSSRYYPKDPTLYEFISIYAPPCYNVPGRPGYFARSEATDPMAYTNSIIAYFRGNGITITADMKLSTIVAIK